MSDHVPTEFRRHERVAVLHAALVEFVDLTGALREHLHATLAEIGDAELDDLTNLLRRRGLGDGDERDVARVAFGLRSGLGDAAADVVEFFGKRRSFGHDQRLLPAVNSKSPRVDAWRHYREKLADRVGEAHDTRYH